MPFHIKHAHLKFIQRRIIMKKLFCYFFVSINFLNPVQAKEWTLHEYGKSNVPSQEVVKTSPKEVQIFGERCSGTNFLEKLLKNNCPELEITRKKYGDKHFPCWFGFPFDADFYKSTLDNCDFQKNG